MFQNDDGKSANISQLKRTLLFWVIMQPVDAISDRFRKSYQSHLQGSRIQKRGLQVANCILFLVPVDLLAIMVIILQI
jgi:hypothetical protein